MQAAAGREIVHTNPDKAAEVFERIESVGREALAELRRMLGVLRESGDEQTALAPQPGIDDIEAAVAQSSASGVPTTLVVDGDERPLAAGVELAAYRIVQEALTNVRKHAGAGRVRVELARGGGELRLRVADDGVGFDPEADRAAGRFGLKTMEERASSIGATLSVAAGRGEGVALELRMALQPKGVPNAIAAR